MVKLTRRDLIRLRFGWEEHHEELVRDVAPLSRREFMGATAVLATLLFLPYEPKRIYSFPTPAVEEVEIVDLGALLKEMYPRGIDDILYERPPMLEWMPKKKMKWER